MILTNFAAVLKQAALLPNFVGFIDPVTKGAYSLETLQTYCLEFNNKASRNNLKFELTSNGNLFAISDRKPAELIFIPLFYKSAPKQDDIILT